MVSSTENKNKKKKAIVASVALLAVGFGGAAMSGAYFTDQVVVADNTFKAGTVQIERGGTNTEPFTFDNVLPIATGTEDTNAETAEITFANVGTADVDWAFALEEATPTGLGSTNIADIMEVQYSLDGTNFSDAELDGNYIVVPTELASGDTADITFRAWLPQTAGNVYQAEATTFNITARAIQAGTTVDPATPDFTDATEFVDFRDIVTTP
jgi:predicted ribosomally synthesized peptide with SipW-like signal peptide